MGQSDIHAFCWVLIDTSVAHRTHTSVGRWFIHGHNNAISTTLSGRRRHVCQFYRHPRRCSGQRWLLMSCCDYAHTLFRRLAVTLFLSVVFFRSCILTSHRCSVVLVVSHYHSRSFLGFFLMLLDVTEITPSHHCVWLDPRVYCCTHYICVILRRRVLILPSLVRVPSYTIIGRIVCVIHHPVWRIPYLWNRLSLLFRTVWVHAVNLFTRLISRYGDYIYDIPIYYYGNFFNFILM